MCVVAERRPARARARAPRAGRARGRVRARQSLALEPLDPEAVRDGRARGAFGRADDRFARECYRATRGNPFLIAELMRELAVAGVEPSGGSAGRDLARDARERRALGGAAAGAPRSGRRRLRARRDGARRRRRSAPRRAAGRARRATGWPSSSTRSPPPGILRSAERLAFEQPLVARAVESMLTPSELAEAHLAAARLLSEQHAPARARGGAPAARTLLRQRLGRRRARRRRRRRARTWRARHRRHAICAGRSRSRRHAWRCAGLTRELGRAEALAGKPQAAGRLSEAVRLADDPRERALTTLETGRTLCTHGRFGEAAEVFRERPRRARRRRRAARDAPRGGARARAAPQRPRRAGHA